MDFRVKPRPINFTHIVTKKGEKNNVGKSKKKTFEIVFTNVTDTHHTNLLLHCNWHRRYILMCFICIRYDLVFNHYEQIRRLNMPKLSRETLEKRLNDALKALDRERKMNLKLWNDFHNAQIRIQYLENKNSMLRLKDGS